MHRPSGPTQVACDTNHFFDIHPLLRVTLNCSGVSCFCHSASVFTILLVIVMGEEVCWLWFVSLATRRLAPGPKTQRETGNIIKSDFIRGPK